MGQMVKCSQPRTSIQTVLEKGKGPLQAKVHPVFFIYNSNHVSCVAHNTERKTFGAAILDQQGCQLLEFRLGLESKQKKSCTCYLLSLCFSKSSCYLLRLIAFQNKLFSKPTLWSSTRGFVSSLHRHLLESLHLWLQLDILDAYPQGGELLKLCGICYFISPEACESMHYFFFLGKGSVYFLYHMSYHIQCFLTVFFYRPNVVICNLYVPIQFYRITDKINTYNLERKE